jgi:hypothetical protein
LFKIFSTMFLTFYIYAVIGCEVLRYSDSAYEKRKDDAFFNTVSGGILGNFQSFPEAFLALSQILTESGWHYLIYYVEEFNGFVLSGFMLMSFHLIINYILRSILLGLIWEVFIIVNTDKDFLENAIVITEEESELEESINEPSSTPGIPNFHTKIK